MHSFRERHHFCELAWLRAPWEPKMLLRGFPGPSQMLQKLQFWLRIRSPWLPTPRYSVTTKRNTSPKLSKPLPSPRDPIFDPKIAKIRKFGKLHFFPRTFSYSLFPISPVWGALFPWSQRSPLRSLYNAQNCARIGIFRLQRLGHPGG